MSEDNTPRAWIGCLACYNNGHLVGEWFPAIIAGTVEVGTLHLAQGVRDYANHEELWVMDHEYLPIKGECSPMEAQSLAEVCAAIEDGGYTVEAVQGYAENHGYDIGEAWGGDFEEAYNGEWDDREDFAYHLADDIGAINPDAGWPNSYIDWERAARDLFMDYFDAPAPGGRIYVYRSM